VRFHLRLCPYSKNICYNSAKDIIPVGTVGELVTGSSGIRGLGRGSGMIGTSSSLGIVGAKITTDETVIQNDQLNMKCLFSMLLNGFWWGNLRERDHLEDLGIDWRIILRWIFRKLNGWGRLGGGGVDWIDLTQDTDRWQARVNAVMNLGVP
jgi:hypothetical protein